ncbi:breast carcinoma-amplified sequence 1 isoform X1 [Malaclemys terrapin pileata]|uniref:breast carcinoma-amplified sequence 1 isoform X1 n=1 Tax=Malaclemys terrapin pileata TaxID=2991368 RepID=UPI0023A88F09|nr:breast carcinoma-amplified sequence 1 isoform X1 [Malaclemys terrapin pileata]XP_053901682.1 breast carcinoma-amplified sequence 1 isoform X1 [Malaclemys terrapin pileata]
MGNNLTVQEEAEDQDNVCTTENYQVVSEPPTGAKNGPVTIQVVQTDSSENDKVDARTSVEQNNVAVSSQKTTEISSISDANGKNLGTEAKKPMPAAKSRFVFSFSRPVPGRTEEQATDSSVGSAKLDVSSEMPEVNKASSEKVDSSATAVLEEGSDKNLSQAPSAAELSDTELIALASPETEDAAASKTKQVTFFDRLFKLEKGKEKEKSKTQVETQEESQIADFPDAGITAEEAAGLQSTPNNVPQGKDIDDCNQKAVQQGSAGVNTDEAAVKQENPKAFATTDNNNSVMSFFKTLVSPSKSEAKSDSEDKESKVEKGHGGHPAQKTAAESQAKGAKKKKSESPRLGHKTFSKLFRHKSTKEAQQTTNAQGAEQQPVTSVNVKSEKNTPPSQESQTTKQNAKASEPATQQQATAATTEAPKDMTKERSAPPSTPLSKLFWKKTAPEDTEVVINAKVEASLEAVAPDKDETKTPETAEVKLRREENKNPKTNLRKFFKLSVKNDGGATSSEEVNGPDPSHQTSGSTERPVAPTESEPVGQKSKESSKDKTSTTELSKQETQDQQDSREQQTTATDSIQNGGDTAKDSPLKKMEKRQSFGGFFKGLGPKRMSDAEVQTDPVSILPAGKSK